MVRLSGAMATAKLCRRLKKYRKFVKCAADEKCVRLSYPLLLCVFAKYVLSAEKDIEGKPESERTTLRYIPFLDAQDQRETVDPWSLPEELYLVQMFFRLVLAHLCA